MVRHSLVVVLSIAVSLAPAKAQESPVPGCFTGSLQRAAELAKERQGSGGCGVVCKGCGCRGGPGYRNAKGHCVSYKRFVKECGPPPYLKCKAECVPAPKNCQR